MNSIYHVLIACNKTFAVISHSPCVSTMANWKNTYILHIRYFVYLCTVWCCDCLFRHRFLWQKLMTSWKMPTSTTRVCTRPSRSRRRSPRSRRLSTCPRRDRDQSVQDKSETEARSKRSSPWPRPRRCRFLPRRDVGASMRPRGTETEATSMSTTPWLPCSAHIEISHRFHDGREHAISLQQSVVSTVDAQT